MIVAVQIDISGATPTYVLLRNEDLDQIYNGSSLESFNPSNRSTYGVTATEQTGTSRYEFTVPSNLPAGNYSATLYQQFGGSPAAGDQWLGTTPFVFNGATQTVIIPGSSLALLIASLRVKGEDTATSNLILGENPSGQGNLKNDGSNTNFRLQNRNIVSGSAYVTINSSYRSQSGFTVDTVNGLIVFGSAPVADSDPFYFDYNFYWFADSDYQDFVTSAVEDLGFVYADPIPVPSGLYPALIQYSLYYYWTRRSTQYAHRYSSSGGQASQTIEAVTKNFMSLASQALKAAVQKRDDFYKRQGQRNAPASSTAVYRIDPITPIR